MADAKKKTPAADKPKLPKGFGFTLRGKAGDTMRVQSKYRAPNEIASSVTKINKDAEGKKVRKIGARAKHTSRQAAEAWQEQVKAKLTGLGWQEKIGKTAKADAFDLESLPAPDALPTPAAQ